MTSRRGLQRALIAFSIRYRGAVIALGVVLLVAGITSLRQAKYDVFPEFAPPQATIQTEAPGMTPEQVELLVTQPIENDLNGSPGLQSLRSASIQGLSLITATFDPATDVYRDRQIVAEHLAAVASQLPRDVPAPSMTPLTSSTSTVLVVGLTSPDRSTMDLRAVAESMIRPRLLALRGVAKVPIFGSGARAIRIQVHPAAMARFGVSSADVLAAAQRAAGVQGAGFIDTPNQRILLQTVGGGADPGWIAAMPLPGTGGAAIPAGLTIGDVANVAIGPEPATGGATTNGEVGVQLVVSQQYGANTLEVTRRVEAALEDLRPSLAPERVELHTDVFRPANFIETATGNVWSALIVGAVLVVVVLALFLFDLRVAAISSVAIPLSLLAALIVLRAFGVSINTMTLGGLAVSIGVVVDDAVIDIENIVRRLRENRWLAQPRPPARVILDACLEVRSAVVYATFAIVLVVVPILALGGLAGQLFSPLAEAFVFAVLASLLVSLTVIPALAALLLAHSGAAGRDPPLLRWSRRLYERLLARLLPYPGAVLGVTLLLTIAGAVELAGFGASFLPELREDHFILHMSAVPGTSIDESLRLGKAVTETLRKLPAVRAVAQRVGRAEKADDVLGTHYSEFDVDLKQASGEQIDAAQVSIRAALDGFPGVGFAMQTFLAERIEETLSGYSAPIVINVFGPDLDLLDRQAAQIARIVSRIPGAKDVQIQSPPETPQLAIRLRAADCRRWGIAAGDVLDAVRIAYEGETATQVFEGNRPLAVIVALDDDDRSRVDRVGELPLRSSAGAIVRLREVADIEATVGRYQVLHQSAQRLQTVTADFAGRDVGGFAGEIRRRIAAEVRLPAGSYIDFAGEAEAESQSRRDLLFDSMLAAVGIVLLVSFITGSLNNLLLVLANLPFAFVGGVAAVMFAGAELSLGSMVGFIALFGITLRNSILVVAHYEDLVSRDGCDFGPEVALRGAADRLAPIMLTSIVTALGLLPMVFGRHEAGREIQSAMAIVILGGLATSMLMNLLVLPTLALKYARFAARGQVLQTRIR
jgi:CzcA family heavy metal efflux pump